MTAEACAAVSRDRGGSGRNPHVRPVLSDRASQGHADVGPRRDSGWRRGGTARRAPDSNFNPLGTRRRHANAQESTGSRSATALRTSPTSRRRTRTSTTARTLNEFAARSGSRGRPSANSCGPRTTLASIPSFYTELKNSKSIVLDKDEHDVFGDGRVVIKSAPGHTPGHQTLILGLAATGRVMLSGDLYHYPRSARCTGRRPTTSSTSSSRPPRARSSRSISRRQRPAVDRARLRRQRQAQEIARLLRMIVSGPDGVRETVKTDTTFQRRAPEHARIPGSSCYSLRVERALWHKRPAVCGGGLR